MLAVVTNSLTKNLLKKKQKILVRHMGYAVDCMDFFIENIIRLHLLRLRHKKFNIFWNLCYRILGEGEVSGWEAGGGVRPPVMSGSGRSRPPPGITQTGELENQTT